MVATEHEKLSKPRNQSDHKNPLNSITSLHYDYPGTINFSLLLSHWDISNLIFLRTPTKGTCDEISRHLWRVTFSRLHTPRGFNQMPNDDCLHFKAITSWRREGMGPDEPVSAYGRQRFTFEITQASLRAGEGDVVLSWPRGLLHQLT